MRKMKKSLAVILAVLMLASFMPLFASAQIALARADLEIIPPSVSPSEINYGTKLGELTLTGGECWYINPETGERTKIEGEFRFSSTSTKPAVNEAYTPTLKFYPTDTETYKTSSTLSASLTKVISGTWPTIRVRGAETVLVEAPVSSEINSGESLGWATLSGGIVHDADGNVVSGRWSFADTTWYPVSSGEYPVQFKATGYETLKTNIFVSVKCDNEATLVEKPVAVRVIKDSSLSSVKFRGGKVVDSTGAVIEGTWAMHEDAQNDTSVKLNETGTFTYKAQWRERTYSVIVTDVQVTVVEDKGYEVTKEPAIEQAELVADMTYADLTIIPGEATIPGTFAIVNPSAAITAAGDFTAEVKFSPDDLSYEETTFTVSFNVQKNKKWADEMIAKIDKITLPYDYRNAFLSPAYSTFPAEYADICSKISWSKNDYVAQGREPGDIQLVKVTYMPVDSKINGWAYDEIYIQIEPGKYTGELGKLTFMLPQDDILTVIVNISIPGITGTVIVKNENTVIGEFTPDENGKIYERIEFKVPADGVYNFTADYIPGVTDKVIVENTHIEASTEIEIRMPVKVVIHGIGSGINILSYEEKSVVTARLVDNEYKEEEVEYWEVKDENGKTVTVYGLDGKVADLTQPILNVIIPDGVKELHFYPQGPWDEEIIIGGEDDFATTLLKFWQKIVDFIVEIYTHIMNMFG